MLSSADLRSIGNDTTCVRWVEDWLKKIHHLYNDIKRFGDDFQRQFDMKRYTVVFEQNQEDEADEKCKVSSREM